MPTMIIYRNPANLDEAQKRFITRAVYIMRSVDDCHLVRYGQIGGNRRDLDAKPTDTNNAHRRLAQVEQTWRLDDNGRAGRKAQFDYALLVHLEQFQNYQIIDAESIVQAAFAMMNDVYGAHFRNNRSPIVKRYRDGLEFLVMSFLDAFIMKNCEDIFEVLKKNIIDALSAYGKSHNIKIVLR